MAAQPVRDDSINGSERDNNDRDLACTQLAQKLSIYNIIEF